MKRNNSRLLFAAFAAIGISASALGQTGGNTWNLDTSSPTQILFNQTPIQFLDAQPGLIDGQLMVPVRAIAEQTGATVVWDNDAKQVEIDLPNEVSLTLTAIPGFSPPNYGAPIESSPTEDSDAVPNNVGGPYEPEPSPEMLTPTQVVIIDGHAYMPLDKLATAFDGTDSWDQSAGTATITVTGVGEMPPSSGSDDTAAHPGWNSKSDDDEDDSGPNMNSQPDSTGPTEDPPNSDSSGP